MRFPFSFLINFWWKNSFILKFLQFPVKPNSSSDRKRANDEWRFTFQSSLPLPSLTAKKWWILVKATSRRFHIQPYQNTFGSREAETGSGLFSHHLISNMNLYFMKRKRAESGWAMRWFHFHTTLESSSQTFLWLLAFVPCKLTSHSTSPLP